MMKSIGLIVGGVLLAASAQAVTPAKAGQSSQPADERKAQDVLPMAHDTLWNTLLKAKIAYSDKEPHITATIPPVVKALNGKQVELSGFVLPMDSQEKTTHFLLSKRTPTCPFCPPGEPNEVVEVYTKKPVAWNADLITVSGHFSLTNNTEQGIFFVIKDGMVVSTQKQGGALPAVGGAPSSLNQPSW